MSTKFHKRPTDDFDRELLSKGKKRSIELANVICQDTGKKDSEGNPIFTFGSVYKEKIVSIDNPVKRARMSCSLNQEKVKKEKYQFSKSPKVGSKLHQAVEIVKTTGKDDKPMCIVNIQNAMGVTKGNASIYYSKSLILINQGLV